MNRATAEKARELREKSFPNYSVKRELAFGSFMLLFLMPVGAVQVYNAVAHGSIW